MDLVLTDAIPVQWVASPPDRSMRGTLSSTYLRLSSGRGVSLAQLFKDRPLWQSHTHQGSVEGIERKRIKKNKKDVLSKSPTPFL